MHQYLWHLARVSTVFFHSHILEDVIHFTNVFIQEILQVIERVKISRECRLQEVTL